MNKKYNLLGLVTCLLFFALSGCNSKEDPIMQSSSKDRVDASIEEYRAVLTNGPVWKLEYVTPAEKVFTFLIKFSEGGRVTMVSDFVETPMDSSWKLSPEESIVLSFDTYTLLHLLADPSIQPTGKGFEGDFEFVLNGYTESEVFLIGRKHGSEQTLTRVSEEDWTDLIDSQATIQNLFGEDAPLFRVLKDAKGEKLATLVFKPGKQEIDYYYVRGDVFTRVDGVKANFKGAEVTFGEPLVVDGIEITDCTFVEEDNTLVIAGNEYVIAVENVPTPYPNATLAFLGEGEPHYASDLSKKVAVLLSEVQKDFNVAGLQFYWMLKNGGESFTTIATVESSPRRWLYFILEEQMFLGTDGLLLVPTGNLLISGEDDGVKELINHESLWDIFKLIVAEGKGVSVIPSSDENEYYIVSRIDPTVWLTWHRIV